MSIEYFSVNRYPGDGVTTVWDISFAGGYIDREHVKAFILSADGVQTDIPITDSMFVTPFRIDLGVAAPVGGEAVLFRDTPKDIPLVDFQRRSRLTEANLDKVAQQAVFGVAEIFDAATAAGVVVAEVVAAGTAAGLARDAAQAAEAGAVAARIGAETARIQAQAAESNVNATITAAATAAAAAAVADSTASSTASASAAAVSASAAAASATAASGSAVTATTQAEISTTQASTAITQAGIATTQADIATTQAANASTSASAAAASASAAAASAAAITLPIALSNVGPVTAGRLIGRDTGTGNAKELTRAEVLPVIGSGSPSAANFLRGDGSWQEVQSVPAGTVIHVAMNAAPSGYLKANGALVSRTAYAALFAAIGTTFGAGDGSTTFALPNLRGEFIRGWDDGRGVDDGRVFGSAQSHQMEHHIHQLATAAFTSGAVFAPLDSGGGGAGPNRATLAAGGTSNGGENRPRNVALLACIKF